MDAYLRNHGITDCWFAYSNIAFPASGVRCKPLPTGLALRAGQPQPVIPAHIRGTVLIGAVDISGILWGAGDLNPYSQFRDSPPVEMIGNSILVYRGEFDVLLLAAHSHASQVAMLMRMRKRDAALGEASTALAMDSRSPMLEATMGATLLQLGRVPEANEAFSRAMQKAREHKPDDESAAVAAQIAQLTQSSK